MALSVAGAQDILKEFYKPAIREQLNNTFFILEVVAQNTDDIEGIEAVLSLHMSRNRGVGARGELATLPTPGQQGYKKSRVPLKFNYGRLKVSGPILRATKTDKGSFTRALDSEVKGLVRDLKRDVNRQCWTNESGSIGVFSVAQPTATTGTLASVAQARRLEPGYQYDIVNTADDLIVRTVTLTSVNLTTGAITYVTVSTGPGTAATTNRIVNSGVTPSANDEITGLEQIVDSTGTLFGIDPASYPRWSSTETAVSGLPTDSVFEVASDEIFHATGETVDLVVTSTEVVRTFAATLKSQKRFSMEPTTLKGGFKAVSVATPTGEFALRAERDVETSQAFGLTTSALTHYSASDWEFMDEDGAMLSRSPDQDAYEATLYRYHELATDQRNAHFKLTGLTVV